MTDIPNPSPSPIIDYTEMLHPKEVAISASGMGNGPLFGLQVCMGKGSIFRLEV